ncbi:MAG TPA: RNA polymerase sigma factor [Candidatus Elarobacter sp.]|jgi:RNA polymerase sigma-70 factor (ECF subfamily)|nr:RNA polymerase sigma factor [Candidatus Elarobacter sp.]
MTFSEELVRCRRSAFAVARGVLHDFDAAEEAVQEAAYRAWRAAPRFDGARPFRPWFLRIVRNTAVNELQRRARVAPLASEPCGFEPSLPDIVIARERTRDVLRAVQALPKDHRAALVLRGFHGLDYKSIANVLAIPPATARIHVHRARLELRDR